MLHTRRNMLQGMVAALGGAAIDNGEIQTRRDWERARRATLAGMEQLMGPLPPPDRSPLDVRRIGQEETARDPRVRITYLGEPNDPVPAWLMIP